MDIPDPSSCHYFGRSSGRSPYRCAQRALARLHMEVPKESPQTAAGPPRHQSTHDVAKHGNGDADGSRVAHTLTACCRCRSRKTRCDPALPRCGPCERTNAPCDYFDAVGLPDPLVVPPEILKLLKGQGQEHLAKLRRPLTTQSARAGSGIGCTLTGGIRNPGRRHHGTKCRIRQVQ